MNRPYSQRVEPTAQPNPTDLLKKEIEVLNTEIDKLKLENSKLLEQNDKYFNMISEINTENLQIMALYEFRGKLLKALEEKQEKQEEKKE
jgi:hypothetical protein